LASTRAQIAIMRPDPHSRAMRTLFGELIDADAGLNDQLVAQVQGLDIRYDPGPGAHPLAGRHVPDPPGIGGPVRLPRPVLVDLTDSAELRAVADGWRDRVDVRRLPAAPGVTALLVRPDGYVAWATNGIPDPEALRHALSTWFGQPQHVGAPR
jgi:hypothetical protein